MKAISHTEAETGSLTRVAIAATPLSRSLAGLAITKPIQVGELAGAEERVLAMLDPRFPGCFPAIGVGTVRPWLSGIRSKPCRPKVLRVSPLGRVTCAAASPETEVRLSRGPIPYSSARPQRRTVIKDKTLLMSALSGLSWRRCDPWSLVR